MAIEICTTCKADHGYVCGTCSRPRDPGSPRRRAGLHGTCAKRRTKGAMKPCPSHTETLVRCDYCRVTAAPKRNHSGLNYPDGWTLHGSLWGCPMCTTRLAVAADAVVAVDEPELRGQRTAAIARLTRMLGWVTPEIIADLGRDDPVARVALWDAITRARAVVGNNGLPGGGPQLTATERLPIGVVVGHNPDGSMQIATNGTVWVQATAAAVDPEG